MNKKEFLAELKKIPGTWTKTYGMLRTYRGKKQYCPLTAVCYEKTGENYDVTQVYLASAALDLDLVISKEIVKSADCAEGYSRYLRSQLLKVIKDTANESLGKD